MHNDRFNHDQYLVRRKVFKLFGQAFHVYDPAGNVVLYSKLKAFKLREDIRLYTGEDMATEVLSIRARQIIDFSAAYDVIDSASGQPLGSLKRKGFKSLVRDEWMIFDPGERQIGLLQEDSTALALVRRFVDAASLFLPQKHHVEMGGQTVCRLQQNFNPFVFKMTVDFSHDPSRRLDRRLGLAIASLVSAIEGRQD
jgi:uncharacterized protein YxjI